MGESTYTSLTDDELRLELRRLRQLKVWPAVRRVEDELKRRHPQRVELAQDAYYYGTAADFAPR